MRLAAAGGRVEALAYLIQRLGLDRIAGLDFGGTSSGRCDRKSGARKDP